MNMHWIDWAILGGFTAVIIGLAIYTTRFMRSVADFLAGNRCAGRYLLTMDGINTGAISLVAVWELWYNAGFASSWWGGLGAPVGLLITLSGWIIYRYRQTRAFTLAQFFEMRYSRNLRIFAGFLAYLSGVINYGIFPGVAARFFVSFCGLPEWNVMIGGFEISLMYALVMAILLGLATTITLAGGQIAIMITDCLQGIIGMLAVGVIGFWLLGHFSWDQIFESFQRAPDPENASMINPFKIGRTRDFNIWYYLIGVFGSIYGYMSWQGSTGTTAAPKTPHEARMARVIGGWRGMLTVGIVAFLPVCAFTVMHHPDYASLAQQAREAIGQIHQTGLQTQMTVPIVLGKLLPVGLMGLLSMIIFCAMITTDDTYLHSWGSILVQDFIMPFRKRPFTPEGHIRALRWSIAAVAVFGFIFSLLFRHTQYILLFFAITGAIFTGGAGAVIIGGLYWKRGTTAGAWCAMLLGSTLAVAGIIVQQFPFDRATVRVTAPEAIAVTVNGDAAVRHGDAWECDYEFWKRHEWQTVTVVAKTADSAMTNQVRYIFAPSSMPPMPNDPRAASDLRVEPADGFVQALAGGRKHRIFVALRSVNGQVNFFIAMVTALAAYVIVSLLGRRVFNMDEMLHRGKYAIAADQSKGEVEVRPRGLRALVGITPEFTKTDKLLYHLTLWWSLFWMAVFFVLLAINLVKPCGDLFWFRYWRFTVLLNMCLGIITVIWFTFGGIADVRDILRTLKNMKRNVADDGRVEGHHNVGESFDSLR
ncbi:MAG: hypothetical protein PHR35_10375 [Kiritimatiellae bacterium]|nr:hypothetical protein [Kiritimatiellia bacterium]